VDKSTGGGLNPGGPCEIKFPLSSGLISKHSSFILLKIIGLCKSGWKQCCSHGKIDLKDKKEIAERLFGFVNLITEVIISQPKQVDELYENLPNSIIEKIKKRGAS